MFETLCLWLWRIVHVALDIKFILTGDYKWQLIALGIAVVAYLIVLWVYA